MSFLPPATSSRAITRYPDRLHELQRNIIRPWVLLGGAGGLGYFQRIPPLLHCPAALHTTGQVLVNGQPIGR